MSITDKFQRVFSLAIFPPYKVVKGADGGTFLQQDGTQDVIYIQPPFTIEFAIRRQILASANTGSLRIYNLNSSSRNRIYKDPYDVTHFRQVILKAGYGNTVSTIFKGNVSKATSCRSEGSVDFITEIEGYDMSYAMQNAFSNWGVAPTLGNPVISRNLVVDKIIMDLGNNFVDRGAIASFPGSYPRGRVVSANSWQLLQTETENNCFIDNGKVHCLKDNDAFQGDILEVNSGSGLLGTPKRADKFLLVDMIFEPRVKLGQLINLNSRTLTKFNGQYKVVGIDHIGTISDAVGGKCKTTLSLFLLDQQLLRIIEGKF